MNHFNSSDKAHYESDREGWASYILKNNQPYAIAIAENEQKAVEKAQLIAERLNEGSAEKTQMIK